MVRSDSGRGELAMYECSEKSKKLKKLKVNPNEDKYNNENINQL